MQRIQGEGCVGGAAIHIHAANGVCGSEHVYADANRTVDGGVQQEHLLPLSEQREGQLGAVQHAAGGASHQRSREPPDQRGAEGRVHRGRHAVPAAGLQEDRAVRSGIRPRGHEKPEGVPAADAGLVRWKYPHTYRAASAVLTQRRQGTGPSKAGGPPNSGRSQTPAGAAQGDGGHGRAADQRTESRNQGQICAVRQLVLRAEADPEPQRDGPGHHRDGEEVRQDYLLLERPAAEYQANLQPEPQAPGQIQVPFERRGRAGRQDRQGTPNSRKAGLRPQPCQEEGLAGDHLHRYDPVGD